jgi:hypothetical protein
MEQFSGPSHFNFGNGCLLSGIHNSRKQRGVNATSGHLQLSRPSGAPEKLSGLKWRRRFSVGQQPQATVRVTDGGVAIDGEVNCGRIKQSRP